MGGPDPDRNSRVKFQRRSQTLKDKAHELAKFCDANVYLFVNHQRKTFVYNSVEDGSWPPNDESLEQQYSNLERTNFSEMDEPHQRSRDNLSRFTQYFSIRRELFRSLEDLYRDMGLANVSADEESSGA
ncbi:hypothetical protein N7508_007169 [Penicillium antarcticum]|uniref:uncharacterized protein n=1 Tax=Penicillium antarcticum TaxID=416450 RepID=UPI00238705E5|nr:uncharacterized protein N7508_007169 [Penicillium antarcticum]KAJ5302306.1 hypothetical protein N7508_007169 [Penicillium antarcticum]